MLKRSTLAPERRSVTSAVTISRATSWRSCGAVSSKEGSTLRLSTTWMTCQPNWVLTGALEMSPLAIANAASPNSGTIWSLAKKPRSPPLAAAGSVEWALACSAKSAPP